MSVDAQSLHDDRCPCCGQPESSHDRDTTVYCGACGREHVFWEQTPRQLAGHVFECVDCDQLNVVPTPGRRR